MAASILGLDRKWDLWELDNSVSDPSLGSLFDPWGDHPVGEVHGMVARAYGASRAFISTNGTTGANSLAILTLVAPGDRVLVERDCHVSVLQTLNLIGAVPVWLVPPFDEELGVNLASTPAAIAQALQLNPDIKSVVLTSPKYFGIVGELASCVDVCHEHGARILVDEAHGACLAFHPKLPVSATEVGADLVTQSTHKTTEALSQGSVLLMNNDDLCPRFLDVLHGTPVVSTSFNFAIVASVEEAISNLVLDGETRLGAALGLAEEMRSSILEIPGLGTWGGEAAGRPGFAELDLCRVTVDLAGVGFTGVEAEALLQRPGVLDPVVAELGTVRHLLFIVTYGNTLTDIESVLSHLRMLVASVGRAARKSDLLPAPRTVPPQVLSPRDAFWAVRRGQTRTVPAAQAIDQVSAECVAVYPPGNAILVHGERVTQEAVEYLSQMARLGAHLKGASDAKFETLRVLV